jgi:hypothetical protein
LEDMIAMPFGIVILCGDEASFRGSHAGGAISFARGCALFVGHAGARPGEEGEGERCRRSIS